MLNGKTLRLGSVESGPISLSTKEPKGRFPFPDGSRLPLSFSRHDSKVSAVASRLTFPLYLQAMENDDSTRGEGMTVDQRFPTKV